MQNAAHFLFETPRTPRQRPKLTTALATLAAVGTLGVSQQANTQTAPTNNVSAIWWVPTESGWGLNISEQGNTLVAGWYTYGDDNKALWLLAVLTKQANGSFSGDVSRYAGVAFDKIAGNATTGNTKLGTATLTPNADGTMQFSYTVGTTNQTKKVERFLFNAATTTCTSTTSSRASATNYQDVWFSEAEPGWGLNFAHQGPTLVAAWYTYRADGTAQWVTSIASATTATPTKFSGSLFRNTGIPFLSINGAPASTTAAVSVGTVDFTFTDGQTASMTYTLDGITQTKPIKRFVFGSPQTVCADSPAPSVAVPTDPAKLNAYLQAGSYKTWAAETSIHRAASPHPTNVRSFANPILETAMRQGATKFPVDSAVVKEIFDGANNLTTWAVSVKTANNGSANDWYWYEVVSSPAGANPIVSGNGLGSCAGCHSAGTDYVRTKFPFQK
jgi:hypothetical protein